jgi:hypothetical protein
VRLCAQNARLAPIRLLLEATRLSTVVIVRLVHISMVLEVTHHKIARNVPKDHFLTVALLFASYVHRDLIKAILVNNHVIIALQELI